MKIKIDFGKRAFLILLVSVILVGAVVVQGFNENFDRTPAEAITFGHSADELIVDERGTLKTFQQMFEAGLNPTQAASALVMFDSDCPTGWTRVSDLDGKTVRGAATYGAEGGSQTHSHPLSLPRQTRLDKRSWRTPVVDFTLHAANSWSPYENVVWCKQ